jgi:hypothetical protein
VSHGRCITCGGGLGVEVSVSVFLVSVMVSFHCAHSASGRAEYSSISASKAAIFLCAAFLSVGVFIVLTDAGFMSYFELLKYIWFV